MDEFWIGYEELKRFQRMLKRRGAEEVENVVPDFYLNTDKVDLLKLYEIPQEGAIHLYHQESLPDEPAYHVVLLGFKSDSSVYRALKIELEKTKSVI